MKKEREILCGGVAWLISALAFVMCLRVPAIAALIGSMGNINILVYGVTLVLFCLSFLAGMFLTNKIENVRFLERTGVKRGVLFLLLAGQSLFFVIGVSKETAQVGSVAGKYGWHTQPLWLMAVLFLLETVIFFYLYQRAALEKNEGEWILWLLYGILTILVFYSMDTPNIFGRGEWGDSYHAHAYFNSIYNVHWGMPYTAELTSIYGHYGLLWKIPMKLIGGDFRKFVLLMAALGALTHLGAFLVLEQLIKSRVLRALGALAISFPILGMRGGYYWQLWPHRMVFPVIMLLYAGYILKRKKFGWRTAVIGYIICTIGVVWNTETGMLLAVAWAGVHMTRLCSEGKWSGKNTVRTVTAHALGVIGSLAGAYGLVNLYNILKHSPANTIKEFMLPLMSEAYMTDVLHLDLPLYPSAYMAEVTLFLIGIALGIAEWRWFRKKEQSVSWQIYVVFFLSLSALGRLVYYVNRPAYHNLDCCHFSAVIMLAYLGERGLRFVKERQWKCPQNCSFDSIVRGSLGVVCAAALLAMSTGVVLQFSQNSRIKENFHNRQEFDCFTETIAQQIPANTFAFGLNIAEIYSALHWNSQCFTMDFSDLFVAQKSAADLMEQMQQQEAPQVFTSAQSLPTLEKYNPKGYQWFCENYVLDKTFPIQGEEFQYYVKREGE